MRQCAKVESILSKRGKYETQELHEKFQSQGRLGRHQWPKDHQRACLGVWRTHSQINRWKKEALEALPEVFGSKKDSTIKGMESESDLLFQQIGKLQVEVGWLKKNRSSAMSITEKRSCINPGHELLSIQRQCELIDLPRSSY